MSDSYADRLRKAMRSKTPPITRRKLKELTSFSYEHIRKIVAGLPLMSERFNDEVCAALGLDAREMWELAMREKLDRNGPSHFHMVIPDQRLATIWKALSVADQERMIKIGEGIVETRLAEKNEQEEDDPEIIRERINHLMDRMAEVRSGHRELQRSRTPRSAGERA